jgi:hypothetical protein
VSAPTERSTTTMTTIWPGLLEKLMAAVRAEFRVDIYVPDPDHPVLGRGTCPVADCDRSPTEHGLCPSHGQRWRDRRRPDLVEFLADPGPPLNGRRDLTSCTVPGCRYGSSGLGLCMRHRSAWNTSGHTDPAIWATTALAADPADRTICGLPFCSLWIDSERNLFCKAHETRWRMRGRPSSGSSCSTQSSAEPTKQRSRCRHLWRPGPSARPVKQTWPRYWTTRHSSGPIEPGRRRAATRRSSPSRETSWTPCTRAAAGTWSIPVTSGVWTGCPV